MKYLLDANTLIGLMDGAPPKLGERAAACDEGDLATSAIAFAEVALGGRAGKKPSVVALDALPRHISVEPFDHLAAREYAALPIKRGSYDRLIAAHALALNLTLVTNNERDFADIPGLTVENWTS